MKKYAVVLKNRVVFVSEWAEKPKFPPDSDGNAVLVVECAENVNFGMMYDAEIKQFSEPPAVPVQPVEKETQLDRIEKAIVTNNELAQFYENVVAEIRGEQAK